MTQSNVVDFRLAQLKAVTRAVAQAQAAGDRRMVDERLAEAEVLFNALKQTRFGVIDLAAQARKAW